jgi:hypothetical protein
MRWATAYVAGLKVLLIRAEARQLNELKQACSANAVPARAPGRRSLRELRLGRHAAGHDRHPREKPGSSTPQPFGLITDAADYWIACIARAMTGVLRAMMV